MGTGQYINTFTPQTMPQFWQQASSQSLQNFNPIFTPQFTPQFTPSTAFTTPSFGAGMLPFNSFGSLQTKTETTKEDEKRRKKEEADRAAAEFQQRMNAIKQRFEAQNKLNKEINELEQYTKNLNITIEKGKNGKESADGTIKTDETWEDYNKLPWWKKGLRAGVQLLQGTAKLAMTFVGYETDPKTGEYSWNWKKGLKNGAIAATCIALTAIPVVGPIISTGLLATGVVCGAIGTGKGINKAMNAKNPEELDNAFQDMGAGLTIGVTSALGLRGLGKSAQVASSTSSAVKSNCVTQFVKDATINAYRATVNGVKNQQTAVATNGFWSSYGTNLKSTISFGKTKYENTRYETSQQINSRLNEITHELNNTNITPAQRAILQREEAVLQAQKAELGNVITRDGWKNLKTDSKLHNDVKELQGAIKEIKVNGSAEIDGNIYNNENLTALKEAAKRSKQLSKQIETLAKARSSTIKKMAFHKKFASEVEAYTGKARSNRFGRIYDAVKINKSDITWKKTLLAPFKAAWQYMNIPFKIWGYTDKNGGNGFYKIQETFIPVYEAGMLDPFLGFGKQTLTTVVTSQNEKGEAVQQEVAVTKEILSQLEQQKQQYEQELANSRAELAKLYIA